MSDSTEKWNAALAWTTLGLVLVSLAGLGFMWQERSHSRLTVRPYIDLEALLSMNNHQTAVLIANDGLGPAIVRWAEWRYEATSSDDQHLNGWSRIRDVIKSEADLQALPRFEDTPITVKPFQDGEVIPAGHQRLLLGYPTRAESKGVRNAFHRLLGRLEYSLCYCSVYDECWLLRSTPGYSKTAFRSTVEVDDCDTNRPLSLKSEEPVETLDEMGTDSYDDRSSPRGSALEIDDVQP